LFYDLVLQKVPAQKESATTPKAKKEIGEKELEQFLNA
jgi:hypothetical protein